MKTKADSKSLRKKFIKYLLPSVSAMWVFSLYTMVDGIFVSRGVGPLGLAAVNISMPLVNLIFALSMLFSTGTSTIIAISLGEGNLKKANQIFTFTISFITIMSFALMALILFNLDYVATLLGATPSIINYVKEYLSIIIFFNGFFIVSYSLEVIVKTDGKPHLAIVGVSLSALLNIVLDYIFVMKLHLGVAGAAYATGISQVASTILFLAYFFGKNSRLKFTKFKFDFSILKRILCIGFPDSITELSAGLVLFLFNQTILGIVGEQGIITFGIIAYVNTLVLMTMVGITQGMQPLVSFYYGKKEEHNISSIFSMSFKTIIGSSIFIFILSFIAAPMIVGIFLGDNSELIAYSIKTFRIYSFSFLILGFNVLLSGYFAALEKPVFATIISLARGLFFISISLFVLPNIFGEFGIWISALISEAICLVVSFFIYKVAFKEDLFEIKTDDLDEKLESSTI